MRYTASEKLEMIQLIENAIPQSTVYAGNKSIRSECET